MVDAFDLSHRAKGCTAYNPDAKKPTYGYVPTLSAGIVYTVVFGIITMILTFRVVKSKKWWYLSLPIGAFCETLGWAGRSAAHHCPYNSSLFSLQISILIIAPCFYSAGIYYVLGELIRTYGRRYSLLSPMVTLIIFIGSDLVSIAVQGAGGGLAASAGAKVPPGDTGPGTHTMLAGIIFQLVTMSTFVLLWFYYIYQARHVGSSKILTLTTSLAAALILIRNYYRAVELGQGWDGYLITHEPYFLVLDSALMAIVPIIWIIFWPSDYVDGIARPDVREKVETGSA